MGGDRSQAGWTATTWLICIKGGSSRPAGLTGGPAVGIGPILPPAGEILELQPQIKYGNMAEPTGTKSTRVKEDLGNTLKLN